MCASVPGPIVPTINASGQVVITIVPSRVVKEISSGAETVAVDHPSWSLRHTECFGCVTAHRLLLAFVVLACSFTRFWLGL